MSNHDDYWDKKVKFDKLAESASKHWKDLYTEEKAKRKESEAKYNLLLQQIKEEGLDRANKRQVEILIPEHNSDVGDEFVRMALIRAYEICQPRDALPLEYVIRMHSDPDQWKEFYEENNLEHYHLLGE